MLGLTSPEIPIAIPKIENTSLTELVDRWTIQNLARVRRQMLAEKASLEKEGVEFKGLSLSESPVCRFWLVTPPPEGFKIVVGEVLMLDEYGRPIDSEGKNHYFARATDGGQVLCFTAGQFLETHHPSEIKPTTKPGDRIAYYQEKAPDLFTDYGNGLVRLFGTTEEIRDRLDLWYRKNPRLKVGD